MSSEQLLWSDERIIAEVDDALWEADSESRERARRLLRQLQTDYEARLRTVTAERDEVLEALKMAYRKHHLGDESIGWSELSDHMLNALCETMGDEAYLAWSAQYGQGVDDEQRTVVVDRRTHFYTNT